MATLLASRQNSTSDPLVTDSCKYYIIGNHTKKAATVFGCAFVSLLAGVPV